MSAARELRPHQVEAVGAVVAALDEPPGGIPTDGLRASVVAACGTGKTLISAHSALRIAKGGRVLVMLPTLDLLTQTVREWRAEGHDGRSVAVCSLDDDAGLYAAGVRTTTSPVLLSERYGRGPVTMYATYASLPSLIKAFSGELGPAMHPLDLVVVDEAHRTSGHWGKAWAAIHDQSRIPAARRLYFTATPRVWRERPASYAVREGARDPLPAELACSMDDESVFGPVVYELGLADAISLGLLARYQILVVEVRDPVVTPERLSGPEAREEHVRGQRLGALQAALLRTAADHGLEKIITFHHRTVEAEAFCKGLEQKAAELHAFDPEKYPRSVWAGWLRGEHDADHRSSVLAQFGGTAHRAVLSNCRVLGEGVDCPAVDSVALLDPKGSVVDIVQAIGRALRQKPNAGKVASLIVPVFLSPDEKPADMVTSASYRPLVKVLTALRAHDERAVEMLATPEVNSPRMPGESIGPEPEEGEEESRMLLRFSSPRDPAAVAELVSLRVIDTERQDWTRGYWAARRWSSRTGHLRVPLGAETEWGYPLGRWIRRQRAAYASGQLDGRRVARLERLGMVWDPAEADWQDNLAAARLYMGRHGTLAAPRHAVIAEPGGQAERALEGPAGAIGRPIGQWLSNCRRPGALSSERAAQLAAIDPDWCPDWPIDWQRHYAGVRALVIDGGAAVDEITPGVTVHGADVGRWLQRQRETWAGLSPEQQRRLRDLGVSAPEPVSAPKAGGRAAAWERGVAAARAYLAREGTLTGVPRGHVEHLLHEGQEHAVKLGVWLTNQRARRASLPADRAAVLSELGVI
ncbi:DEAD/DEAH box helicase [Streptomyces antimicrobicus]|uniref:Helicase associated domain protein n=1 Tax=Streptomyces antimicrobicus TaxID=2883108 RepID=A0ABS8BA54_9ACTN|nr:DEAD/DEAH box helicase [Streptomyces antimicrobicus]MCB5181517.1 Helicase associated domain protein [Streptomyces antimicrobicus]